MKINIGKNLVLIAGACVFEEKRGYLKWFLVKQNGEEDWEIPKVVVRKGESSVRAVLRMTGEKASITARVLEEAGRFGGITKVNGKKLPQRHIYYLMHKRAESGESTGFTDSMWLTHAKCLQTISTKREKAVLKAAKKELARIKKEGLKNKRKFVQKDEEE
jgi:ADP-ribose pyrophosphatase YjhB (NUDIX family)